MNWNTLLSPRRERLSESLNPLDIRTEFRKDYHRIVGSASFRRLQDKAQVYPLKRGDFVRTRLTHSLEVSSFAGSLADAIFRRLIDDKVPDVNDTVRENCRDILECAGLVHDIGNPPFGHFGEDAIRQWFKDNLPRLKFSGAALDKLLTDRMKADFLNFEGNAQALRVLSRLHCLIDRESGMNLTFALLNTIIKYPVNSLSINKHSGDIRTKKMGFFLSEENLFEEITRTTGTYGCRFPLTFLLESADDIAYLTADIEDACVKGLLTYDVLLKELREAAPETEEQAEQLRRTAAELEKSRRDAENAQMNDDPSNAVSRWIVRAQNTMIYAVTDAFCEHYDEIMNGEFKNSLLDVSRAGALARQLGETAKNHAFLSKQILASELSENAVMNGLLEKIVDCALRVKTDSSRAYDENLAKSLSPDYLDICLKSCVGRSPAEQAYCRLQFATDCVAGMTDNFAVDFFHTLNG